MGRVTDFRIEAFVASRTSSGRLKPRTAHNYAFDIERFGRFLQGDGDPPYLRLYDASEDDIRLFLSELRPKNTINSLRRKVAAFDSFYEYLVRSGYRTDNPAASITFPKTPRRTKELLVLTRDQVRRLLEAPLDPSVQKSIGVRGNLGARDRAILYFFYSGAKRHEITSVKATDFDPHTRTVRVRHRQVSLTNEAANAINAYLAVRPQKKAKTLFLTQSGKPMSVRQAWTILKQYLHSCGLRQDVDVEALRRSFAVHALEDGAYVLDVLTALGNISMGALHEYAEIARNGFARQLKSTEKAASEIPFSRFLGAIHEIRVAVTNLVLGAAQGKPGDIEQAVPTLKTQIEILRSDWPSLVSADVFSELQAHLDTGIGGLQEILAEDLTTLETQALALFSENQQKREEAGFIALLHPRIILSSLRHYLDKDYRDAVLNAMLALTELIREKSGLDGDGSQLASRVFRPENPALAISPLKTQSERDEQAGFHKMLLGAYEGIRNPSSHDLFRSVTQHQAAQSLVFISYLSTVVESATPWLPPALTDESPA